MPKHRPFNATVFEVYKYDHCTFPSVTFWGLGWYLLAVSKESSLYVYTGIGHDMFELNPIPDDRRVLVHHRPQPEGLTE
jgi:hypothetical protein